MGHIFFVCMVYSMLSIHLVQLLLYSFDDDKNKCYKYSVIAPAKFKKEWHCTNSAGNGGQGPLRSFHKVDEQNKQRYM